MQTASLMSKAISSALNTRKKFSSQLFAIFAVISREMTKKTIIFRARYSRVQARKQFTQEVTRKPWRTPQHKTSPYCSTSYLIYLYIKVSMKFGHNNFKRIYPQKLTPFLL